MKLITLDFETYYADDYSLSNLTTEAYVRDPRFEIIMMGVKIDDRPAASYVGPAVERELRCLDLENNAVLCHHAHFDCFILYHHYGIRPKIIFDTLAMARAAIGSVVSKGLSLASVANYLGLPPKGDEVVYAKNKRLADFTSGEIAAYQSYCELDVILTRSIFDALRPQFGTEELKLIDLTTRLFTEPILELDAPLLQEYRDEIVAHKGFLLLQAGVVKETLMSNDKFAEELRRRGVEPEMKDSPTAKDEFGRPKRTYAFAKTDSFMKSLLEHEDDVVRTLAEARLGVKTSIAETRAERYIDMASRGPAPIYLKYWGAEQTGRHSAGDKSNFLNLGRNKRLEKFHLAPGHVIVAPTGRTQILKVSKDGKRLLTVRGEEWKVKECHRIGLRDSIRAPKGYMLIAGDSSNIEARMLCYLAGQKDILEVYRAGGDPYCSLASHIFHREITKEDEEERFFGKIGVLGCGYQMGPSKLREAARAMYDIDMDIEMARTVVYTFRETYDQVTRWWKYLLEVVIPAMADGRTVYADPNGLAITGKHMITTGGGRVLRYPNLRQVRRNDDQGGTEWVFDVRDGVRIIPAKLYGGKLAEELTQHFARNVVMAQALKVNKKYRVVHMVYDEIVCCVPEDEAEECEQYVQKVMSTAPSWAPTLPVAAETGKGVIYGCC